MEHKTSLIAQVYADAEERRGEYMSWMHVLLAFLLAAGLAIAWYFAGLIARSHREAQDALETARRALAARDELMGIVAHDLRNPLGAITMKAALLRKAADSETTRKQAESIESITMRMEYLIRSMLDVATIEAGKFSVTKTSCDVGDLLCEAMEMFEGLAASKQIRLEQSTRPTGLVVRADRERVLQVLSNLVGNALKFTPSGGFVTLAVARHGEDACFSVLDTGPGIQRENLAHIFDRFWTYDTPGVKGTGLGLFIVKGIIDAHGGRIWAESEPGHGARFHFTLPLDEIVDVTVHETVNAPMSRPPEPEKA